jgi:SpoVK/Ycf46/Vps4 family AAA+-type ATPase
VFSPIAPFTTFEGYIFDLSLTQTLIRNVHGLVWGPQSHGALSVVSVHCIAQNAGLECAVAALLRLGLVPAVFDAKSARSEVDLLSTVTEVLEYPRGAAPHAIVIRGAETLLSAGSRLVATFAAYSARPAQSSARGVAGGPPRVAILLFEEQDAPSPALSSIAAVPLCKGESPNDQERGAILHEVWRRVSRTAPIMRSVLLPISSMVQWTVGLSVADVSAFLKSAVVELFVRVPPPRVLLETGIAAVLSESDAASSLQAFQKSHGHSLTSTRLQPVRWSDIGGLEEPKREILETIQLPITHPELFAAGVKRRAGILLYGPPGCGKTLLAKAVATELNMNFLSVKGPELINQYVGESEKNIRLLFHRARENSPCIVFFDELDALVPSRGAKGDAGGAMDRIVAQLLVEIDGVSSGYQGGDMVGRRKEVFIIGATNRPDLLDPALLRPGRFDRLCYLGVPSTKEEQIMAVRALTRKFALSDDVCLRELVEPLPFCYTGADFFALCSDAMMFAVDDAIDGESQRSVSDCAELGEEVAEVRVTMAHFLRARDALKPSVTPEELQRYEAIKHKMKH